MPNTLTCSNCGNKFVTSNDHNFVCLACRYIPCDCGLEAVLDWDVKGPGYIWRIECECGKEYKSAAPVPYDGMDDECRKIVNVWKETNKAKG